MKNLLRFIIRYHFFIAFLFIESFSLFLLFNYNQQQKETFISSTNVISGFIFDNVKELTSYLNLKEANEQLLAENSKLRNEAIHSFKKQFSQVHQLSDTTKYFQQYEYREAQVINNSINTHN